MSVYVCRFRVCGWRCIMYHHGRPIYTTPEYIPRKLQSSSNFYIIDYEEDYTFSDTSACLLFTICSNFASRGWRCDMYHHSQPIYTIPEYISRKMGVSANIYIMITQKPPSKSIYPFPFYLRFAYWVAIRLFLHPPEKIN